LACHSCTHASASAQAQSCWVTSAYRKIDFTAVGTTTNLAARLQSEAEPLVPCISRATFEEVGQRFTFKPGSPRRVKPKGLTV
jgi:class 3 adenylate cyclase